MFWVSSFFRTSFACLVRFAAQIPLTAGMPLGVAWILEVLIASSADG